MSHHIYYGETGTPQRLPTYDSSDGLDRGTTFRSRDPSRMKFLQRTASSASTSSIRSLSKLSMATWPSKWSRKQNTGTKSQFPPPKRPCSPTTTRTPSTIPGTDGMYAPSSDDQSESGASEDPSHHNEAQDWNHIKQQRRLAYYMLTGERLENEHDNKQKDPLIKPNGSVSENQSAAVDYHMHSANKLVYENDLSSNNDQASKAFAHFFRACEKAMGSPPPIPRKSPRRDQLSNFGRVSDKSSPTRNDTRVPPPISKIVSRDKPEVIAPTCLSLELPHFPTIEELEAYHQPQLSKRPLLSTYILSKCGEDVPKPTHDWSEFLSPAEKARLKPEALNIRNHAHSSTSLSRELYASVSTSTSVSTLPPPLSPHLPLTPPQSRHGDDDDDDDDDKHSVALLNRSNLSEDKVCNIEVNSSSAHGTKKSHHHMETGHPHRKRTATPELQSSEFKQWYGIHSHSHTQSHSISRPLDPDEEERREWYGREVRLRVERIRRALRTQSFLDAGGRI